MPRIKANGIELEYRETGSPDDPMLLLVSGFSAQMITFPQELLDGLASAGRRVAILAFRPSSPMRFHPLPGTSSTAFARARI